MRQAILIGALGLALGVSGASADDRTPTAGTRDQPAQYDADDTGRNVRDRDDRTVTPGDQGGSKADRELTAAIRRSIVEDDSLSTDAHNVKIVAKDGIVTLRGPVKSEAERMSVASKAQRAPGVKRIDNQLEIERD